MPRSLTRNLIYPYPDLSSDEQIQPTYDELNWVMLYGQLPSIVAPGSLNALASGMEFKIAAQKILLLITPDVKYITKFTPGMISHERFIFVASMRLSIDCRMTVMDAYSSLGATDKFPLLETMAGRKNKITTHLTFTPAFEIDLESSLDPLELPLFAEAVGAVQSSLAGLTGNTRTRSEIKPMMQTADYLPISHHHNALTSCKMLQDIEAMLVQLNQRIAQKTKCYLPVRAVFKLDGDQPIDWHLMRVRRVAEVTDEVDHAG